MRIDTTVTKRIVLTRDEVVGIVAAATNHNVGDMERGGLYVFGRSAQGEYPLSELVLEFQAGGASCPVEPQP